MLLNSEYSFGSLVGYASPKSIQVDAYS